MPGFSGVKNTTSQGKLQIKTIPKLFSYSRSNCKFAFKNALKML